MILSNILSYFHILGVRQKLVDTGSKKTPNTSAKTLILRRPNTLKETEIVLIYLGEKRAPALSRTLYFQLRKHLLDQFNLQSP